MISQSVNSSNVNSVGYDETNNTLEVEFKDGSIYQYYNVPENVYSCLVNAASVGSYLNKYVKNVYQYKKIK